MSIWCEVIQKTGVRIFGEVFLLQAIKQWLEGLHDAVPINRIDNLTHPIGSCCDNAISREVQHDFVV